MATDTYDETVSEMTFEFWHRIHPHYEPNQITGGWSCVRLYGGVFYMWDDHYCGVRHCSVCEINK